MAMVRIKRSRNESCRQSSGSSCGDACCDIQYSHGMPPQSSLSASRCRYIVLELGVEESILNQCLPQHPRLFFFFLIMFDGFLDQSQGNVVKDGNIAMRLKNCSRE